MIFISYEQMIADVRKWSEQLPANIDCFVGVPRSGMLVANLLALIRNVPMADVHAWRQQTTLGFGPRLKVKPIELAMLVEDSALSGKSLNAAWEQVKSPRMIKGALYVKPGLNLEETLYYKEVPTPRLFEWNIFHGYYMRHACVDIDGVLCRDPTREENDDAEGYEHFLNNVKPRLIPTVIIPHLVTGRLEKYRPQTEAWLDAHKIRYKKLSMHPAKSMKDRRALGNHADQKARIYADSDALLFIESSNSQAAKINHLTGRPVFCTDTMVMHV